MNPCLLACAVALALLVPARALGSAGGGFIADDACTGTLVGGRPELIVAYPYPGRAQSDLLFDLHQKGEPSLPTYQIAVQPSSGGWWVSDNHREDSVYREVAFVVATYDDALSYIDSSDNTSVDFGANPRRRLGDSLPVGSDAGFGLVLPGDRSRYRVTTGSLDADFPQRLASGATRIAFAPLPEVNDMQWGQGCGIGGRQADASDPSPHDVPPVMGHVVGYNVHRIPACSVNQGTQAEFAAALVDAAPRSGWIGFVDLRRFRLSVPHDGATAPGPNDLDPGDGVELVNPDGRMYSGDEVLVFEDREASSRPDSWRAPRPDQAYWYAIQPVWRGTIAEFADVGFGTWHDFQGDHRRDLDGDGAFDAVDLHLGMTTPEFISPQADRENGSLDGLGWTHRGMPFVSPPMFAALMVASPLLPECLVAPVPPRPRPRP